MSTSEPQITINGHVLNDAQADTVRVAIETLAMDLTQPNSLGDDEHGRSMTKLYKQRIGELRAFIFDR